MAIGRKTGGRTKGTPNKFDADIKGMILGALAGVGGTQYLMRQAEQNPVAFMGLVGKVLPLTIAGAGEGGALVVDFRWADAPVQHVEAAPQIEADEPAIEWSEAEPKGHAD